MHKLPIIILLFERQFSPLGRLFRFWYLQFIGASYNGHRCMYVNFLNSEGAIMDPDHIHASTVIGQYRRWEYMHLQRLVAATFLADGECRRRQVLEDGR